MSWSQWCYRWLTTHNFFIRQKHLIQAETAFFKVSLWSSTNRACYTLLHTLQQVAYGLMFSHLSTKVYNMLSADREHGLVLWHKHTFTEKPQKLEETGPFLLIWQHGIYCSDASQMQVLYAVFGEADMLSTAKVAKSHMWCQRDSKGSGFK